MEESHACTLSSLEDRIGICIKSLDETVQWQNAVCRSICGDCVGKTCQSGCMTLFRRSQANPALNEGIRVFRGARLNGPNGEKEVDLALIEDGAQMTTILYPLGTKIERELSAFKGYGLSKRETQIVSLVLRGFTNPEIAKKLFISMPTLKTHLNNIYKKLPRALAEDLRALKGHGNEPALQSSMNGSGSID